MKVKVFSMVGISRYETSDDTYNEVGVYGTLPEAQAAMKAGYDSEFEGFDGNLPVDLNAELGERTALV